MRCGRYNPSRDQEHGPDTDRKITEGMGDIVGISTREVADYVYLVVTRRSCLCHKHCVVILLAFEVVEMIVFGCLQREFDVIPGGILAALHGKRAATRKRRKEKREEEE